MRLANNESDAKRRHLQRNLGAKVERVVHNALPNRLRLCRLMSCAVGDEQTSSSEKPIHLGAVLSSPCDFAAIRLRTRPAVTCYRCAFSNCFLTSPFSWRTSFSWLWRSGSWDFCGFGWWLLCLPCQRSGPGCFASPILNSRVFSSC